MDPVLTTGFAIMFLSTAAFFGMSLSKPKEQRYFHYITMFVTGIASFAYLCMAFDSGKAMLTLADGSERKFFWIRYVDWTFTTPLLLLDIGLLAGASTTHIAYIIGCDVLMIAGGILGPIFFATNAGAKYAFFALGNLWFIPILYALLVEWKGTVSGPAKGTYNTIVYATTALWCAYPIMWALCEGSNVLSGSTEVLLYAILDVTAKAALGFVLLGSHAAMESAMKTGGGLVRTPGTAMA